MPATVLIVHAGAAETPCAAATLEAIGYAVELTDRPAVALDRLDKGSEPEIALVVVDLQRLPDAEALIRRLRERPISVPVLATAPREHALAHARALGAGAVDSLAMPATLDRVSVAVRNAIALGRMRQEVVRLLRRGDDRLRLADLVAVSPASRRMRARSRQAAELLGPVSLQGERGTGRETLARAIHGESVRAGRPFAVLDGAAVPPERDRGVPHFALALDTALERAGDGALFLRAVETMPLHAQLSLVQALEDGLADRVRLFSSSGPPREGRTAGLLPVLEARLRGFPIRVPPLRARREDVPGLVRRCLDRLGRVPPASIEPAAMEALAARNWPGNLAELFLAVERAALIAGDDPIAPAHLSATAPARAMAGSELQTLAVPLLREGHIRRLHDVESETIRLALRLYGGRMSEVARRLGIGRSTLYRKLDELQIDRQGKGCDDSDQSPANGTNGR